MGVVEDEKEKEKADRQYNTHKRYAMTFIGKPYREEEVWEI